MGNVKRNALCILHSSNWNEKRWSWVVRENIHCFHNGHICTDPSSWVLFSQKYFLRPHRHNQQTKLVAVMYIQFHFCQWKLTSCFFSLQRSKETKANKHLIQMGQFKTTIEKKITRAVNRSQLECQEFAMDLT